MATATKKLTAEEFLRLGLKSAELIDKEVVESMPVGRPHGRVSSEVLRRLANWAKESGAGEVGTEAGFVIARNPDRVRAPDVYFVASGRLPQAEAEGFWTITPDLAVEVVFDSDTVGIIHDKLDDYFAMGTKVVWMVYPTSQTVEVCTPDGHRQKLRGADLLQDPAVLPSFSCSVAELFV